MKFMKSNVGGVLLGMFIMASLVNVSPNFADATKKTVNIVYNGIKLVVDGVQITPRDAKGNIIEPFTMNGTTYLPVKALGEALGKTVIWDNKTQTVYLGDLPVKHTGYITMDTFLKKNPLYSGELEVYHYVNENGYKTNELGNKYVNIRQEKIPFETITYANYEDSVFLTKSNYTEVRGKLFWSDEERVGTNYVEIYNGETSLFNSKDYLKTLGYESFGRGNLPIEFSVDITGVENLKIYIGGSILDLEFKPIK